MGKVYALLVGINAYPYVRPLHGCLEDVDRAAAMLGELVPAADLALEVLREGDATHANLITQVRAHLGRAGPGDTAYFHYAGHGAQAGSAPEFKPWFASGDDEGLVCWDTSMDNGMLLADKELAVLIAELGAREAHVAVTLDCCHSGSGTRDIGTPGGPQVRAISPLRRGGQRDLASYIDGYYAQQLARGAPLAIPEGRHLLLAACDRLQTAKEDPASGGGIFTTALLGALKEAGPGAAVSYADLFRTSRAAARSAIAALNAQALKADPADPQLCSPQDPQFEPMGGFDVGTGFLGRGLGDHRPRYYVGPSGAGWQVECGAIHGLPVDAASPVTFTLFRPSAPDQPAGSAAATQVLAQTSVIVPDFVVGGERAFLAELTSLPAPPLLVGFTGPEADRAAVAAAVGSSQAAPLALVEPAAVDYRLEAAEGRLALFAGARLIHYAAGSPGPAATALLPALATIARWERLRSLDNPRSALDRGAIGFAVEVDGQPVEPDGLGTITLDYTGAPRIVRLLAGNGTVQPWLHMMLVYFANDFAIRVKRVEPLPGRSADLPEGGTEILHSGMPVALDADEQAADACFRLLVATEPPDGFLFEQDGLAIGAAAGAARGVEPAAPAKVLSQDWLAKTLVLHMIRRAGGT